MRADMETEQGQTSRFAEVYVRSVPAGFRLACLLAGDRALAEDLVQEAILRFVGRLHHLRDPEAFDAYLREGYLSQLYRTPCSGSFRDRHRIPRRTVDAGRAAAKAQAVRRRDAAAGGRSLTPSRPS